MRNIVDCMCPVMATPMNTMGMGDVSPLNGDPIMPGSGDKIEQPNKKKKKHKMKSLKDRLKKLINESKYVCNAYVLVGIPGSGKSTWCKNNHPDLDVVSRDITRAELGYTKNADEKAVLTKSQENEVSKVNHKKIQDLVNAHKDFIIDDTNTGKYRKLLIDDLKGMNVNVIGVNFNTPLETCIERRKGQIPEDVMRNLYNHKIDLKPEEVNKVINVK